MGAWLFGSYYAGCVLVCVAVFVAGCVERCACHLMMERLADKTDSVQGKP